MKYIACLFVLFFSFQSFGQPPVTVTFSSGNIVVNKDPRFDVLAEKQAEINKRASKYAGSGIRSGYRIQVINTQNRDEANAVRAEMLRRFPDQKAYMQYQAPNFRVRIGNFLTQKEARTIRSMIASLYPDRGIYIVPDRVEYRPQIDEEDL
jgi:hypothetical protein